MAHFFANSLFVSCFGVVGDLLLDNFTVFGTFHIPTDGGVGCSVTSTLPLARPALVAPGIISFVALWNDYEGPLIMLSDSSRYTFPSSLTQRGSAGIEPVVSASGHGSARSGVLDSTVTEWPPHRRDHQRGGKCR